MTFEERLHWIEQLGIHQVRVLPSINLPSILNDQTVIPASASYLFGGFNRSLANIFRATDINALLKNCIALLANHITK